MKHKLFIAIICLIFGLSYAKGQETFKNIRFGPEISPQLSWMFTNDNQILSEGNNIGLRLGLMGERILYRKLRTDRRTGNHLQLWRDIKARSRRQFTIPFRAV